MYIKRPNVNMATTGANKWQIPLTTTQKKDLDVAVIDYIKWNFENETEDTGMGENTVLQLQSVFGIDSEVNAAETSELRNQLILPRKWNSIVQLQRKIMTLEQNNKDLINQMESLRMENESNSKDTTPSNVVSDWLPRDNSFASITTDSSISTVKIHPQLPIVFVATDNGKLYAYDIFNTSMPLASIQAHTKGIVSMDSIVTRKLIDRNNNASEDELQTIVTTSSKDLQIKVFTFNSSANKFKLIRSLLGHDHIISQVKITDTQIDPLLFSCSRDCTIKVWNLSNGFCIKSIKAHNEWIRSIDIIGDYILSGSQDSSLRLTHWPSGNGLSMATGHTFPIESVKLIPLNAQPFNNKDETDPEYNRLGFRYCVSASRDNLIKVWEIPLPKFISNRPPIPNLRPSQNSFNLKFDLIGHTSWVKNISLNATGNYLFSCSDDKSLRCWNLGTGKCIKVWQKFHSGFINCLDMDSLQYEEAKENSDEDIQYIKDADDSGPKPLSRSLLITGAIDCKCNILMK